MNLFRSEEHARRWSGFRAEAAAGLRPVQDLLAIFSARLFRERLNGRYVTDLRELSKALAETVKQLTADDRFWRLKA